MYSNEERIKVIKPYIEYGYNARAVIRELGYPSRNRLAAWYKEYCENGTLERLNKQRKSKYTIEQRQKAIEIYLNNGKSIRKTIKALGYPGKTTLCDWLNEDVSDSFRKWSCKSSRSLVRCTTEQKEQAVKAYCAGIHTPTELGKIYNVDPFTIYRWRDKLLGESKTTVSKGKNKSNNNNNSVEDLLNNKISLEMEVKRLEESVRRLRLEKDILKEAANVIKKDKGINIETLSHREKTIIINALRDTYPLVDLLKLLNMAKSSYCYQNSRINHDKYKDLRKQIKNIFIKSRKTYGYRRIHSALRTLGIIVSEKVVQRIIKEEKLIIPSSQTKKYNSYKGEISPEVENIIDRDFHADKPNVKWLTDITEFRIPAGKVYLSPIIDCFDGLPISWTISNTPNAELVNTMLDEAISTLSANEKPIVHSDRGSHYRWPGWIKRMDMNELTRSISKKGCSPDNAACEGFFGRLKNEMFYGRSWSGVTINEFIEELDTYIKWYAEKRIKISLGGMSPIDYRRKLGITI